MYICLHIFSNLHFVVSIVYTKCLYNVFDLFILSDVSHAMLYRLFQSVLSNLTQNQAAKLYE